MKKRMNHSLLLMILFPLLIGESAPKRPMQPEDLMQIRRISDPRISPDGKRIAYTLATPDLLQNKISSDIWYIPISGGASKQLTISPFDDHSPCWSPDGKTIAFLSDRNGPKNLFLIPVNGGEARQLTFSKTDLYQPVWSKDGKTILCGSRILPEGKTDVENPTKDQLPKCTARTINKLPYRHWDTWLGDERNHVFLVNISDGQMTDLTPGDNDAPPVSLSGNRDFDISPDGREVYYVKNLDKKPAFSTNHDLFIIDTQTMIEKKITGNPAWDGRVCYSPDGNYIAYVAMSKPGYESDRTQLIIYNRKNNRVNPLSDKLDRSVEEVAWSPDSKILYFTARDEGRCAIYSVDLNGKIKRLTKDGYNCQICVTPDGLGLVFRRSYNHLPDELFFMALDKNKVTQLTFINKLLLDELELLMLEEFWFKGADGDRVQAFLLKPPGFDARKKYPLVLAIHGGPQNMWADRFMTTWFTFQLITSPGYVGLFINPRGSTGYGSKFREQVSHDYGGRAYEDLMSGLDYAIKQYDFIDPLKTAAIGGSYGGYCVNWILGHTDRFKCLVSHAGLYNLESFYGSTDELWYPAWDIGKTPWDVLTNYPDREIFIEGHTDNVPIAQKFEGKYKSNWELSTSRALSVLHYVRQHPKASPYRLRVVGYGEQKPIADNSTEEGRSQNRRVEIVIGAKLK